MACSRRTGPGASPVEMARATAYGAGVRCAREHPRPRVGPFPSGERMGTWLNGHEAAMLRRLGGHIFWSRFLAGYNGHKTTAQ